MFAETNVQITAHGQWHFGIALGSRDFAEEYVAAKIESWAAEVSALAEVASSHSHAAYCVFIHGMVGYWIYLMRTIPNICSLFQLLEDAVRLQLISSLTGHTACSAIERDLFSLPCRFGTLILLSILLIFDII